MKPAIENEVQIYEQEQHVKIFWRKEFLEDEQSEKTKIKLGQHFGEIQRKVRLLVVQ